ncbi:Stf0 family sulfotransferase [Paenibacillus allorhizosphaerae]|uniref:Trehalose 2-sulfotransferase n=1 Tax=Paenibacillus allorhizosphaerae TaxID=2849866 RepID=A0ABM8V9T2_9BACL|nr:Stf0 family sulfotransferase [Paenibacillus allorhizosphaerae]CAG7614221.1 Trehalose 2-sulfotransferase [Paenibacillus allorhizosphaerae]
MTRPTLSYTIWFSQRTGSTLLNYALASTGVAGDPSEWLHFQHKDPATFKREDMEKIWKYGTTPNGVFGIKIGFEQRWIDAFRAMFELPVDASRAEVWSTAFPNCSKHIYMTRRNKVRLAVSWWRAIVSGEWHRNFGEKPQLLDIADKYNYEAIQNQLFQSTMCEAAIEDFFSESSIEPLTIVYEDFIQDYEGTVKRVLAFLGIPADHITVAPPALDKLADDVAEQWVQRFREESQKGWKHIRW